MNNINRQEIYWNMFDRGCPWNLFVVLLSNWLIVKYNSSAHMDFQQIAGMPLENNKLIHLVLINMNQYDSNHWNKMH